MRQENLAISRMTLQQSELQLAYIFSVGNAQIQAVATRMCVSTHQRQSVMILPYLGTVAKVDSVMSDTSTSALIMLI